jgi:type II secretory pathway component GspD/PulD (secretin)
MQTRGVDRINQTVEGRGPRSVARVLVGLVIGLGLCAQAQAGRPAAPVVAAHAMGGAIQAPASASPGSESRCDLAQIRVIRVEHGGARDLADTLSKAVGPRNGLEVVCDSKSGALILRGPDAALDIAEKLLKELDVPAEQVQVETRLVTVDPELARSLLGKDASGSGQILDELERKGQACTLPSPRLMAVNGTQAQFRLGEKIVFTSGNTQPPEERDVGTIIDIVPHVDRQGVITLSVSAEQSTASFPRGGAFPLIRRGSARWTVRIKSGHELLIGPLSLGQESDPGDASATGTPPPTPKRLHLLWLRPSVMAP